MEEKILIRIQVTEDGVTTTYIYSGLDILYEETMNGTAVYIYGPTGRIAKRREGLEVLP